MMPERRAEPKPGKCGLEARAKRSHWTGKVYPPLGFSSSEKSVWLLGTDWPAGGQVGIGRSRRGCRHCALCPACSSPSTPRFACPPADLTSPPRGLRVPQRNMSEPELLMSTPGLPLSLPPHLHEHKLHSSHCSSQKPWRHPYLSFLSPRTPDSSANPFGSREPESDHCSPPSCQPLVTTRTAMATSPCPQPGTPVHPLKHK